MNEDKVSIQKLLVTGITGVNMQAEENTRGHLTTREMYAVQPNRSVVKSLRRGINKLFKFS